jgi:hypothetical protein
MIEKCVTVSGYGIVGGNLLVTAGKCGGKQQQTSKKFLSMLRYEPSLETHCWR